MFLELLIFGLEGALAIASVRRDFDEDPTLVRFGIHPIRHMGGHDSHSRRKWKRVRRRKLRA
jgi:hypothetical protein